MIYIKEVEAWRSILSKVQQLGGGGTGIVCLIA